jgi:hypothetical protein
MGTEIRMDFAKNSTLEERLEQSRAFKRVVLRKLQQKKLREGQDPKEVYATIASEFLSLPSLDNVDRLSTVYGYSRVRRAISLLDNLVFEEFFYGKVYIYPLWIKQFTRLLDAARPRPLVKELLTSSDR